jgi:trehalose 6-phosphate synthase
MLQQSPRRQERAASGSPWLQTLSVDSDMLVLAHRAPFAYERTETGQVAVRYSSSGVVNAVEPLIAACGGTWIAHGNAQDDREFERSGARPPDSASRYRVRRVGLSDDELEGYYYGFANEALWPLCHRAHVRPIFRSNDLQTAWAVNARFAAAVAEEAASESPLVLVQDYHFALAPQIIRERLPQSTIVTFWHVPWPDWQTFEICPWRHQILEALLRSTVVGFQTATDCRNFIDAVEHAFEARFDRHNRSLIYGGRRIYVRAYPASVRWTPECAQAAPSAERQEVRDLLGLAGDVKLAVAVDRLDYTKGLEEKFLAVERLLDLYPEFAGRFVLVQMAEPSRSRLEVYSELRSRVRAAAERINRRFGGVDYCPIILIEGQHTPAEIARFMRAADVCYVGSLHDGMNLVSKEFVSVRADERGVLLLSEFTGAARQLTDAVLVNPYDVDGAAAALAAALSMAPEEQGGRMRRMRRAVYDYDAYRWGAEILSDAMRLRAPRPANTAASQFQTV